MRLAPLTLLLTLLSVTGGQAALLAAEVAGPVRLQSVCRPGQLSRVMATLEVGGTLVPPKLEKQESTQVPLSVQGKFSFDEKRIGPVEASPAPGAAAGAAPVMAEVALRHYRTAEAQLEVGGQKVASTLTDDHRLIAVEALPNRITLYSPRGALRREELDLIDLPGNTLVLDQLLPTGEVSVGSSWKPDDAVVAKILNIEAVSQNDLQCAVEKITDAMVQLGFNGKVSGAIGGVSTELEIKGRYRFDRKENQVSALVLAVKERRSVGHASPGLDVVARLTMQVLPLAESPELSDAVTAIKLFKPGREHPLAYTFPDNSCRFAYDRTWHAMRESPELVVFRQILRGDLIAQCNVAPLKTADNVITLADFQADVEKSLGKLMGTIETASESTNAAGMRVYRVQVSGKVQELPIRWIYYLVKSPTGQRMSVVFTMEGGLVEQFANADKEIIAHLELSNAKVSDAAQSVVK